MGLLSSVFDQLGHANAWLLAGNAVLICLLLIATVQYSRLRHSNIDSQARQRDLIENLSDGIYRTSPDGRQLSANKALVRLNGYDSEVEMLSSVRDIAAEWYVDPERRDAFRNTLARDGVVENFVSEIYRHKTRERIWVSESARLVTDQKTGQALYYEGSVREITESMQKREAERLLHKLSNQIPGGLFQFARFPGGQYSTSFLSDGFRKLMGFTGDEGNFPPDAFAALVHPDDRPAFQASLRESGVSMQPWEPEFRMAAAEHERWLRINAIPEAVDGCIVWHGYINDVSARKRDEVEIQKLAFFDPLTGLPNRRKFMTRLEAAVKDSGDHDTCGALIFIDLDNFKTLNDTRGHDVGDEYLVQVAQRLSGCVRPRDTVARIGGDEFVIILEEIGRKPAAGTRMAIMTANKVLTALRTDFEIGDFKHRASASLGVVVFAGAQIAPDELLKQADIAMYQAKAAGRDGMALYDHASMSAESARYRLLYDLKAALAAGVLDLHYQPQVDDSGRVVGAEGLSRWPHPELGMLTPEHFMPLTEQFGLIREFGNSVLSKGIAELARWQANPATAHLRMALNVNVQSFTCDDFVPHLQELFRHHAIDVARLTLELNENVMTKDRKLLAQRMSEVKKLGVRLSLDDFGSGYSSLAQLKKLPFDELKIDGCFVADIEAAESDRALIKSILGTARTLKLTAVAEHVENVRQEAFLRAFGCDFFQGYLYSAALDGDAFIQFVERRQMGDTLLDLIADRRRAS